MCIKKSRIGIAKLFRGAMNSCGLSMLESGLRSGEFSCTGPSIRGYA